MKRIISLALLLSSLGFVRAQDAPACAPDSGNCRAPAVVYAVPVVYQTPVVYQAPVVYYAPVFYSAPPPPVAPCYAYPQYNTGSTVVHITRSGTYAYTRYLGNCGSTVIHIRSR